MILIDTSVWISFLDKSDINHSKAQKIFTEYHQNEIGIFDHIYTEVLTVLRIKVSEKSCHKFADFVSKLETQLVISDREIFTLAKFLFFNFKKLSFTDSLLLASARITKSNLSTFDKNLQKAWTKICEALDN